MREYEPGTCERCLQTRDVTLSECEEILCSECYALHAACDVCDEAIDEMETR
jgi:hypothetical protein